MKILVIDDEDSSRVIIGTLLDLLGHETVLVESGKEGISTFKSESFDLAIVDLHLKDMMGYEVCKNLRKRDKKVKLILMSGSIDKKELERYAKAYNISHLVQKPIKTNLLEDILQNV